MVLNHALCNEVEELRPNNMLYSPQSKVDNKNYNNITYGSSTLVPTYMDVRTPSYNTPPRFVGWSHEQKDINKITIYAQ